MHLLKSETKYGFKNYLGFFKDLFQRLLSDISWLYKEKKLCEVCVDVATKVNEKIASNWLVDHLEPALTRICAKAVNKDLIFCEGLLDRFSIRFWVNFVQRVNDPRRTCNYFNFCDFKFKKLEFEDFKKVSMQSFLILDYFRLT